MKWKVSIPIETLDRNLTDSLLGIETEQAHRISSKPGIAI